MKDKDDNIYMVVCGLMLIVCGCVALAVSIGILITMTGMNL